MPQGLSIRHKLQAMILLTTAVVLAVVCTTFILFEWRASLENERDSILSKGRIMADSATAMLAFDYGSEAEKLLAAFRAEPDVRAAALYNLDGRIAASYQAPDVDRPLPQRPGADGLVEDDGRLVLFYPVSEGGKRLGTLYLRTDLRDMRPRLYRYALVAVLIFAGSLVGAGFVGRMLQQTVSEPIHSLAGTARSIAEEQNYRVRAEQAGGTGELAILTTAFNQMLDRIEQQQTQLRGELAEREQAEQALRHSQQQLELISDALPALVSYVDRTYHYRLCNRAYTVWFDLPREQVVGRPMRDVLGDAAWKAIQPRIDAALSGQTVDFETEARYERGGTRWIHAIYIPHRDTGGEVLGIVVMVTDITARKRVEEALRKAQEHFRALAENIPQLAWMTEADGSLSWVNQRWIDYTGLTLEETQQAGWQTVHHPAHAERVAAGWARALETGEPWEDTFPVCGKDGHYRWFLSRAFPIHEPGGGITRWFGTNTDVDDQKRAEERLEKLVAERTAKLTEMMGDLEAFSYSLVHDMCSPLRAMQSFAQLLAEECAPITPAGEGFLQRITTAADRMDRLIQDGLSYSRVMRAHLPLAAIDVAALIRGMLETYPSFQPPQAHIRLEGEIPRVRANEAGLTHCISNLLGNAVKFVAPGVTPEVRIHAAPHNGRVRLHFTDNGIGIDPAAHEKIFELFQRLDPKYEGTGIGLAIVKKSAERMGGAVGVESDPGKGSTFWIDLDRAD